MTRASATQFLRELLNEHNLSDWHVRLTTDITKPFLGMCSYKDKCIILNAHHIDTHPDVEIINTIRHEVAHAIVGSGNGHNEVWKNKAKELGCDNTSPCAAYSFSAEAIDAIRSGATLEVSFEEEIVRRPTYKITQLKDKCPFCGKTAIQKFTTTTVDRDGNDCQLITLECFHIIKKIIPKATPFESFITYEHRTNGCAHTWDKNLCTQCGAFRPFEFQVEGAKAVERGLALNKGFGIFDEMGLGKTVQSLAYINFHSEALPVLYVVKSGIKFQWFKEIIRWLGPEYLAQVISTSKDPILPGLKSYIVAYDLLVPKTRNVKGKVINQGLDIQKLIDTKIKTIVLDECQLIKNPDSSRTQQIRKLVAQCEHVIPLSGTPWKNRGGEFFTVLNMLSPTKFPSKALFDKQWVDFYWDGQYTKEGGIRNVEKFKAYISDIVIRRERTEVMKDLPLINRTLFYTQPDETSQEAYDEELGDFVKWWNEKVIGGEEDSFETQTNLLAKLARMRHITGLAKIPDTINFVEEFLTETERKLCIFVHHKDVGEILYSQIKSKFPNVVVLKLTADLSSEERFNVQELFNKLDRVILVGSTLASGEGLNLQTCADCIMHERQWNPANEEQAEGRFIRIGQTAQSVNATYMTASGTVDEHLAMIVDRKRAHFHNVMNKGTIPVWNEKGMAKELAQILVAEHTKKNNILKFTKMVKKRA